MRLTRIWPVLALLGLFWVMNEIAQAKVGFTYDEGSHLTYGLRVSEGNSDRFDDSKMPVSVLNALLLRLDGITEKTLLTPGNLAALTARVVTSRHATVFCAVLLGLVIFGWAAEMYGYAAGLLALALYVFEPNLAAHSQLVTTDLYAALFTALALYTFWRFLAQPSRGRLLASATALGLAQIAKYSAAYLYPLYILIGLVWLFHRPVRPAQGPWPGWRALVRPWLLSALTYVVVSAAVINVGFLFNRSLTTWGKYEFTSSLFKGLQGSTRALGWVPVPLPYPYVQGLDLVKEREETGKGYGPVYLLGETRIGRGFPSYYLVAFIFKTPLALQILLGWAAVHYWRHRKTFRFGRDELVLAVPATFFALYFSFFFRAQIGLRYFLVAYPLFLVFAGGLVRNWAQVSSRARIVGGVLVGWMVVSYFTYFGQSLAYFNELVGPRINAYRVLADSNLDWGQNRQALRDYLDAHLDIDYVPPQPQPGRFIADVNIVTGVTQDRPGGWIGAFKPVEQVAFTYLVFNITAEDLRREAAKLRK